MKEKRQTKSTTDTSANSPPANNNAPTKKSGSVVGGLALFIALGSSAVSAYLYTELQKFRNQTNTLVESSSTELKSGVKTEIDGVLSQVSTQLLEVTGKVDTTTKTLNGKLDSSLQEISGKFDVSNQSMVSGLDTLKQDLQGHTNTAIAEVASITAAAVQELTNKTEGEINTLNSSISTLGTSLNDNLTQTSETLNQEFTAKFGSVEETVAKLDADVKKTYEVATRGQREWILAEVEYLLRTGGHRVHLAGDTKSAVLALRAASERLHDLGDSQYSTVRAQISEEVAELRQVGTPDIEGVAFELQKLSKRADRLPLPPSDVEVAFDKAKESPTEANAKAMAGQIFDTLKGLVKVEKADGTPRIRPGKPTQEQLSASESLRLNLQAARLSALRRDQQTFTLHMESSETYVSQNYDPNDSLTIAYLEDLAVLKVQPIVPTVGKLGQALNLFTKIHSQRGEN